ncbi:MAG: gluconate 2-dehydrogenase subunit 3 family protein [Proteobacteria bacterium]|nr:gluconate 2-dehydrogenase subunit 3 family protein [Pseudomonadota bacterium]
MTGHIAKGIDRREFLSGAALLALALGIPAAAVRLSQIADDDLPSPRQRLLAREVSQIVLPRTGTPGAGEVGVGDFLILAFAHGLEDSRAPVANPTDEPLRADGSLDHLAWLERTLDRASGGDFLGAAPQQRAQILAALDAAAYPPGPPPADPSPWAPVQRMTDRFGSKRFTSLMPTSSPLLALTWPRRCAISTFAFMLNPSSATRRWYFSASKKICWMRPKSEENVEAMMRPSAPLKI